MDIRTLILVIFILLVVGAGLWFYYEKRKTRKLRVMFGSEYDRVLRETGHRCEAEELLFDRKKQVEQLGIGQMVGMARTRFTNRWQGCQATFVDDPQVRYETLITSSAKSWKYEAILGEISSNGSPTSRLIILKSWRISGLLTKSLSVNSEGGEY